MLVPVAGGTGCGGVYEMKRLLLIAVVALLVLAACSPVGTVTPTPTLFVDRPTSTPAVTATPIPVPVPPPVVPCGENMKCIQKNLSNPENGITIYLVEKSSGGLGLLVYFYIQPPRRMTDESDQAFAMRSFMIIYYFIDNIMQYAFAVEGVRDIMALKVGSESLSVTNSKEPVGILLVEGLNNINISAYKVYVADGRTAEAMLDLINTGIEYLDATEVFRIEYSDTCIGVCE